MVPFWDQNFNEKTRKFDVPFYFKSDFDESRKDKIRIKLAEFARDTCVQMVEVSQGDSAFRNKLEIQQERGCSSYVGRHYAYQMLSLAPGCENSYIPLHEVRTLKLNSHYASSHRKPSILIICIQMWDKLRKLTLFPRLCTLLDGDPEITLPYARGIQ